MKISLVLATILFFGIGSVRSENLNVAIARFLAGEKITEGDFAKIEKPYALATEANGVTNNGSEYLTQIKLSIAAPLKHGGMPLYSPWVDDAQKREKTYFELKQIYDKSKTPLVAYALVCPALLMDDREILPELFAKIAENKPLKAHFDRVYATYWKPRLDPEF